MSLSLLMLLFIPFQWKTTIVVILAVIGGVLLLNVFLEVASVRYKAWKRQRSQLQSASTSVRFTRNANSSPTRKMEEAEGSEQDEEEESETGETSRLIFFNDTTKDTRRDSRRHFKAASNGRAPAILEEVVRNGSSTGSSLHPSLEREAGGGEESVVFLSGHRSESHREEVSSQQEAESEGFYHSNTKESRKDHQSSDPLSRSDNESADESSNRK